MLEGLANCSNLKRLNLNHSSSITDSHISHLLIKLTTIELVVVVVVVVVVVCLYYL